VTRASALKPEDRRRAILEAAGPVFLEKGPAVTTRQIADAAGVAEGTVFRYFPTKEDLLGEVIGHLLHPGALIDQLQAIDPAQPVGDRIAQAVDAMLDSGQRMRSVMVAFHARGLKPGPEGDFGQRPSPDGHDRRHAEQEAILDALADVLRPDLGLHAEAAAAFIRAVTFAAVMPPLTHPALRDRATLLTLISGALRLGQLETDK